MAKILAVLGENIKLARLRRKLSAEQLAERFYNGDCVVDLVHARAELVDQVLIRAASVGLIGGSLIAFAVGIQRYARTRAAIAERLEQAVEARRGD
jgi:hypothetical protein